MCQLPTSQSAGSGVQAAFAAELRPSQCAGDSVPTSYTLIQYSIEKYKSESQENVSGNLALLLLWSDPVEKAVLILVPSEGKMRPIVANA